MVRRSRLGDATDVFVVGGGPAGLAAAIAARSGHVELAARLIGSSDAADERDARALTIDPLAAELATAAVGEQL